MFNMTVRAFVALMAGILLFCGGWALADEPVTGWGHDPWLSSAVLNFDGGPVSLFVLPDGGGKPLTEAMRGDWGQEVDATITATLIDYNGNPIANFPGEDMWLEAEDDGLVPCVAGTIADANTDPNGQTFWVQPLRAGGSSNAGCYVMVNGDYLNYVALPLHFNSADISGDLVVNLTDVSLFAYDFFGVYNYRSDFHCDGTLNIADLGLMAQGVGTSCP